MPADEVAAADRIGTDRESKVSAGFFRDADTRNFTCAAEYLGAAAGAQARFARAGGVAW
jgi:hypothetical protein